jgi:hypothetical protein
MTVKPGWARKRPEVARASSASSRRPLWKLDRGEQRVLMITFAGGVASIVVAAIILGTAIALARAAKHHNAAAAAYTGLNDVRLALTNWKSLGILLAGFFLLVLATAVIPSAVRTIAVGLTTLIIAVVVGLSAIVLVLAVIGLAAGVH